MIETTPFLREHRGYNIPILLYFVACFILLFFLNKGDLVLFFSDNRTDFWNTFFVYGTKLGEEYTYALALIGLLFIKYRYAIFVPIVGGLTAVFSGLLKHFFAHLRPKLWFEALGETLTFIPDIYVNVGHTSFPSGHTFSGFAIFGYLALCSNKWWLKALFASSAIITGLSRVYLAQHFLEDIVFGGFLGTALAIGVYLLQSRLSDNTEKWWNKSILK
jgi:membrane-associated phospholipid phosphatase